MLHYRRDDQVVRELDQEDVEVGVVEEGDGDGGGGGFGEYYYRHSRVDLRWLGVREEVVIMSLLVMEDQSTEVGESDSFFGGFFVSIS